MKLTRSSSVLGDATTAPVGTQPPRPPVEGLPSSARGADLPCKSAALGSHNGTIEKSFSYRESWGRLAGYWPLRCHLCPDGLGHVADISCGDAWERLDDGRDAGRSILVARTRRGQEILHKAMAAKYLELEPVGASAVLAAQPAQIARNREIWGRLLGLRLLLVPTPKFVGFSLFRLWWSLPILGKARTVLGTMRRVVFRGLWRRREVNS